MEGMTKDRVEEIESLSSFAKAIVGLLICCMIDIYGRQLHA